jgi:Domain of unknown function (DUF4148)
MNFTRIAAALMLLAAVSSHAHAQVGKSREQVKQELAEAIRTGDILATGEASLPLNELYPQRYAGAVRRANDTMQRAAAPHAVNR